MIEVRDFQPDDLAQLVPQPEQAGPADVSRDTGERLAAAGPAFTAWLDGQPVLTAGFLPNSFGHAECWCRMAGGLGAAMVPLTRRTRAVVDLMAAEHPRLSMVVRTGFREGHRWARLLGFTREGTMQGYSPEGQDFDLYARVTRG